METEIIKEYYGKLDDETFLIIRGDTDRTIILDSDDEIIIRGDFVEIKVKEMGDLIVHKDTIVGMQTAKKRDFMEKFMKDMLGNISGVIEIRDE